MPETAKRSSGSKGLGISEGRDSNSGTHAFTLRVYGNVLEQVDAAVSQHPVIRNRNTWIVNAIVEQLRREGRH